MSSESINSIFDKMNISLSQRQIKQFEIYFDFLTVYNEKVNLTSITDRGEVYVKHFLDSVSALSYVEFEKGASLVDIGTGAGFPSVPLKIMRPDLKLTLIDSLNKRIVFLEQLLEKLELDAELIHQRAEDIKKEQREKFDYAVSRAVANLRVLSEYDLPYVKCGGSFIAYKGPDAQKEIEEAEKTIRILGGEINTVYSFDLLDEGTRNLVVIKKVAKTPDRFPRPSKKIKTQAI